MKLLKNIMSIVCIGLILTAFVKPATESGSRSTSSAADIHEQDLDKLPHVLFWRKIMNLDKDSCILNVHSSRIILATMHAATWYGYSDTYRQVFLDSLKRINAISDSPRIVGTMGKSFFYAFEKIAPQVPKGMQAFAKNDVNSWYAKAILLIESPNQLQKSTAGAYGPFQLMPKVARNFGLKVNKKLDERANFDRSAYASSQLIKTICIPYTKQMLEARAIPYNENELWFKLFVMHVYNAGAGNVQYALNSIVEPAKGMGLIKQMWNTSAGRFQSSSQNYSQLILAAFLEYEQRVEKK